MPIRIPATLPAYNILKTEGVNVMDEATANRQEVRPLQIGLLNLMPKKRTDGNPICPPDRRQPDSDRANAHSHDRTYIQERFLGAYGELLPIVSRHQASQV